MVTDEAWAAAFKDIDKSCDEEISFSEICQYVSKHLISPKKYAALGIVHPKEIKYTVSDRRGMRIFSTHKEKTRKTLALMVDLSFKVDGGTFATGSTPSPITRQKNGTILCSPHNMTPLKNLITTMKENINSDCVQESHGEEEKEGKGAGGVHDLEASGLFSNEQNMATRMSLIKMIQHKKQSQPPEPQQGQGQGQHEFPSPMHVFPVSIIDDNLDNEDLADQLPETTMDFYSISTAARMAKD